jgi:hypothetical protein
MIREFKEHPTAYIFLALFLILSVISFLAAWPNHVVQRIVAVGIGGVYAIWGILTHVKTSHLTRRVVMEYVVVGMLATVLLVLVTF